MVNIAMIANGKIARLLAKRLGVALDQAVARARRSPDKKNEVEENGTRKRRTEKEA